MLRKAVSLVAAIMILFTFFGCGPKSLEDGFKLDTPEKKYLAARIELNKTLTQFLAYKSALPEDQQAVVSSQFGEYFSNADKALDAWGAIVVGGEIGDPTLAEADYLRIKNQLFALLMASGIVEVKIE